MKNKSLFAPPTDEELESVRPNQTIKQLPATTPQSGGLGDDALDLAKGAGQGLTFGGLPNIGAGIQSLPAAAQTIFGDKKLEDLMSEYKKHKEDIQGNLDVSQKRSPYLYGAGELGGAVLSPLNKVGLAAEGALGLGEAAGVLGTAARGAVQGGTAGAIMGANQSNDLASLPENALKGAIGGATVGGIAAPVVGALGSGMGTVANKAENALANTNESTLPVIQKVGAAIKQGRMGNSTFTNKGTQAIQQQIEDSINAARTNAMAPLENSSKAFKTAIKNSVESGKTFEGNIDASPLEGLIGDSEPGAQEALDALKNGSANAEQLYSLRQLAKSESLRPNVDRKLQVSLSNMSNKLDNAAASLMEPGELAKVKDMFQKAREPLEVLLNKGEQDTSFMPNKVSDLDTDELGNKIGQIFKNNIVNHYTDAGMPRVAAQSNLNKFINASKTSAQKYPELGFQPDDVYKYLRDAGVNQGAVKGTIGGGALANQQIPTTAMGLIGQGIGHGATALGNVAGRGLRLAGAGQAPYELGNSLTNANPSMLRGVADKLQNTPATKYLGSSLHNALDNPKNAVARTAALFSIAQTPEARDAIRNLPNSSGGVPYGGTGNNNEENQ